MEKRLCSVLTNSPK